MANTKETYLTPGQRRQIRDAYVQNRAGVTELAHRFGKSRQGIYLVLGQMGVAHRHRTHVHARRRITEADAGPRRFIGEAKLLPAAELFTADEWRQLYWGEDRPSIAALADRLGLPRMGVHQALVALGIPRRPTGGRAGVTVETNLPVWHRRKEGRAGQFRYLRPEERAALPKPPQPARGAPRATLKEKTR